MGIAGKGLRGRSVVGARTTKAIADELTLSGRTIEGHVYRAMSRTGAATREELAAMVIRRSPR